METHWRHIGGVVFKGHEHTGRGQGGSEDRMLVVVMGNVRPNMWLKLLKSQSLLTVSI